ncbi:MAG: DUF4398 domain-containing protein [Pseudomonadota bacterium]|nr:DUF4398 domain-containing protein [Pseudomonadota bacterium]
MSDARQAIAAAQMAGVTEGTSADFYAAQAAIVRAERHLEAGEYTRARLAAMQAKRHAGAALAGAPQRPDGTGLATPRVATPRVATPPYDPRLATPTNGTPVPAEPAAQSH